MIAQGCVYKEKVRPIILEQLKTVTHIWQECWVREDWLGFQLLTGKLFNPWGWNTSYDYSYLRGWFWRATEKVPMEALCESHRAGPVRGGNVWWQDTVSSSMWLIGNLDMSNSQRSFASNPEFKTHSTCILYSDRLLCISKCVLLSVAGDERLGCRAGKTLQPENKGLSKELCLTTHAVNF